MAASASQAAYQGGLADPVLGSQSIFRRLMDAFAHPGTVADLGDAAAAPAPLMPAAAAILAALADYETPVWFERGNAGDATAWLAFHTGAPATDDPAKASFAVLEPGSAVETWSRLPVGTSSYPDRSATLLLPVQCLIGGSLLQLAGPGIETTATIAPTGLPQGFVAAMTHNRSRFPLGLDVVLTCGPLAVALPRTTRITEA